MIVAIAIVGALGMIVLVECCHNYPWLPPSTATIPTTFGAANPDEQSFFSSSFHVTTHPQLKLDLHPIIQPSNLECFI
jgi:hypothetical protein